MDRNIDVNRKPGLITSMGEVARWRQQGWSWELDVVPVVRAHGHRAEPDPVSTWKFFTEAIGRAHAARTRPPETYHPQVRHDRPHANDKFQRHQANLERAVAGAEIATRLRAEQSEGGW
ncbi:hypothetical protein [Caulobacter hibisci]|uniref:Uncharacterized protein n=1 Tax=Caulobacter hibisci TaxID=2035993 RepID=A0ABS0SRV2_9CAUL|nr:hypothetical protein [Caulobacter hibisci]MBI1682360.1 hypothetical protein [Caulobacter hibisci]